MFRRWAVAGLSQQLHDALRDLVRVYEGRDPRPTAAVIHSASMRGADTVPAVSRGYDGGYAGRLIIFAHKVLALTVEVVKRTDDVAGFKVLPRRWVVERTYTWISKHRRCVRDYETLPEHHEAMVYITMIMTVSRRLARRRPRGCSRSGAARKPGSPQTPTMWSSTSTRPAPVTLELGRDRSACLGRR